MLTGSRKKEWENNEYISDELDNSDLDVFYDDNGITVARAWKVKLIAKKIIEGDADKQYANLWRYDVELQRVNAGNIMKINVDRPNPSIQPRFGLFTFFMVVKKGS